mgnify:CR=1 FL=1
MCWLLIISYLLLVERERDIVATNSPITNKPLPPPKPLIPANTQQQQ